MTFYTTGLEFEKYLPFFYSAATSLAGHRTVYSRLPTVKSRLFRLEAHPRIFRLFMKGKIDAYVL